MDEPPERCQRTTQTATIPGRPIGLLVNKQPSPLMHQVGVDAPAIEHGEFEALEAGH